MLAQVGKWWTYLLCNTTERRLRAGWRVLIYTLIWLLAPTLLSMLIGPWSTHVLTAALPVTSELATEAILLFLKLAVQLGGAWLVVPLLDQRPLADLGLRFNRAWWLDLSFGLLLGALLMAFIFSVEWLAGWVKIVDLWHDTLPDAPFGVAILGPLIVFIVVSLTEELLARGYYVRNLAEGLYSPRWSAHSAVVAAWLISSFFFGLLHARNPNATWISTGVLMLAGLFLGLGYILTGSMALPIGLHLTWNFFQGSVFGFPVSGINFNVATILVIQQSGPLLWTGGAFGPEAGLLGILAILVGCLAILGWVRWRRGTLGVLTELAHFQRVDLCVAQHPNQQKIKATST